MLNSTDVLLVVRALEYSGIGVWLDGGWGIDALVCDQTRIHDDVDIVIALDHWGRALNSLMQLGFGVQVDERPTRVVLEDTRRPSVDLHTVTFDTTGAATQVLQDGASCPYPREGFSGVGTVAGCRVRCLSEAVQVLHHLGYEPDDKDVHDMHVIHARFGIDVPAPYCLST